MALSMASGGGAGSRLRAAGSLLLALASHAGAQPLNIDLNATTGAGAGVPSDGFGAAAAQPGRWNAVSPTGPASVGLVGLDGAPSGVTLMRSRLSDAFWFQNLATAGDTERLLDDLQPVASGQSLVVTLSGLRASVYHVFTYAVAPESTLPRTLVEVAGATDGVKSVGGQIAANTLTEGVTHARHAVATSAGTITITVRGTPSLGTLSGLQIAPCPQDYNASGNVDVSDIFAYIRAWFARDTRADMDLGGTIDVADLFTFFAAFFTPCP